MGPLIVDLLPLALAVVMSPLAIMALVAVLLSRRARVNGIMFLLGWTLAVVLVLALSFVALDAMQVHERRVPPLWVPVVRVLLGAGLLVASVLVYRRGTASVRQMAGARTPSEVTAAAPQLPGWLRTVAAFTPLRSFLLGFGIFVLNPVDVSCTFLAALEIRLAELPGAQPEWTVAVFGAVAVLPIAAPVVWSMLAGERAQPALDRLRGWIAGHTSALNAALLLVVAVMQLDKGLSVLLAG